MDGVLGKAIETAEIMKMTAGKQGRESPSRKGDGDNIASP